MVQYVVQVSMGVQPTYTSGEGNLHGQIRS